MTSLGHPDVTVRAVAMDGELRSVCWGSPKREVTAPKCPKIHGEDVRKIPKQQSPSFLYLLTNNVALYKNRFKNNPPYLLYNIQDFRI